VAAHGYGQSKGFYGYTTQHEAHALHRVNEQDQRSQGQKESGWHNK
jgi:hypothetical protein